MSTFPEIVDRQLAVSRQGEADRQACDKREPKSRNGYGHKRSARKRMASRLAR